MRYKSNTIFLLLILIFINNVFGQETKQSNLFGKNIYYGLGISSILPHQYFLISLSPYLGYSFNEKVVVGVGGTIKYVTQKLEYYNDGSKFKKFKTLNRGIKVFTKIYLCSSAKKPDNKFFLHAELEYLPFYSYQNEFYEDFFSSWYTPELNIVSGIGYKHSILKNGAIYFAILWQSNKQSNIYNSPFIQIGIQGLGM